MYNWGGAVCIYVQDFIVWSIIFKRRPDASEVFVFLVCDSLPHRIRSIDLFSFLHTYSKRICNFLPLCTILP